MAECKDCIHFEICCEHWAYNSEGRTSADEYKRIMDSKIPCRFFKNKSDVVEVGRGKWKEHQNGEYWHYDCPFCDDGYATKGEDKTPPNYCQNCGAKMDGKDGE